MLNIIVILQLSRELIALKYHEKSLLLISTGEIKAQILEVWCFLDEKV